MKKHNGHSNGHAQAKVGHAPSGLQATLAKKIAHKLAQTAGQRAVGYSGVRPDVERRKVDLDTSLATKVAHKLVQTTSQQRVKRNGNGPDGERARADLDTTLARTKISQVLATYTAIKSGQYASNLDAVAADSATAVGANAVATKQSAVAIGGNSASTLDWGTALGTGAKAGGNSGIAVGPLADAGGTGSIAVGSQPNASGLGAIAMGTSTIAKADYSMALGRGSNAAGNSAIAIGYHANSSAMSSVALGAQNVATETLTVSVGNSTTRYRIVNMDAGRSSYNAVNVSQLQSVVTALGGGASINATTGVVTGPRYLLANGGVQSTLDGAFSALDKAVSDSAGGTYDKYMAVKTGTSATDLDAQAGNSATALGANANANAQSAVALGGNTMAGTSAVAIGTLSQATAQNSSALGLQSKASGLRSTALGSNATASADSATSVGNSANAGGVAATVLGQGASGAGNYAVAVGIQSSAVGSNTVVLGAGAISGRGSPLTDGDGNIVIGSNALVDNTGAGAIVIGRNATINNNGGDSTVTGEGAIAVGDGASAYGNNSTAIGKGAYTGYPGGVALGDSAKVLSGTASVALGANTLADADMTVSVGNKSTGLRHRIVNMDAGRETYDGVNVNQLQPVLSALGGNASIDPATGEVTGPSYDLANGGVQTTLSGALKALDQAVSNAGGANDKYFAINSTGPDALANGNDAIGLGSGASASGDQSVALGKNSMADVDNTVSVGSVVIKRKIVNVAPGEISSTSSDAVTGAQLDATNQHVSNLENALNNSGVIDPGSGVSLAVTYSNATKTSLPLGSGSPVEVTNVAPATAQNGAVNLSQLNNAVDDLRSELSPSITYVKVNSTDADATATGSDAVAIGPNAIASFDGALALGLNARVSADQAVALGSNSMAGLASTVSIGNGPAGLKRRLVNMQAGMNADDAVAINQLQPVVTALGGGAAIDPLTGAVTPPKYTFADGSVHDTLDAALSALDQAVSDGGGASTPYLAVNSNGPVAQANGSEAIGLGGGASATANNSVALGANAVADAANTVSVGKPGDERKLVNVAAGDVSATSTEAVNGSQLDATNQTVTQLQDALTGSGVIDPGTGTSLAVTYSNASKNIVLLGGIGTPVEIMNVADGLAASDAATVGQVTSAVDGLRGELGNNLKYVKVNATGTNAVANGADSVAIGSSASATSARGVAIGTGARVSVLVPGQLGAVAIGENSIAKVANTVSIGDIGKERKIVNVADGDISDGSTDAINGGQLFNALGALTTRAGILDVEDPRFAVEGVTRANTASLNGVDPAAYSAMAVGVNSIASGADTAAFGLNAIAQSNQAVAIGSNAQTGAGQDYSVAIGSEVSTNGSHAVAIGEEVVANADNALVIGNNGAFAVGESSIAIGNKAMDRGQSGIVIGKNATASANTVSAIAVGTGATVASGVNNAIALGVSANVTAAGTGGVALGQGAVANRGNAVSLGSTTGTNPVGTRQIINLSAGTQATDAVNVTQLIGVTTALGGGAGVGADGSILPPAYTVDGTSYADVNAALNAVANLSDPNAVSYDSTAKDTITLSPSGTRLTNVSAGNVAQNSSDAINGAQLYGTAESIATNLGGGAVVNPDGSVSKPVYQIDNTVANDVGDALTKLYDAISTKLEDAGVVDPATGRAIAAVTYDGALQNMVTLGGTTATSPVSLTNVNTGALTDTSTDAVNGSQLYIVDKELTDLKDALDNGGVIDPVTGNSLAVTYADAGKTNIALGAGSPVTMTNVNAGALTDTSTDAVNGSQLYTVDKAVSDLKDALDNGGVIDPVTGNSLAVTYADAGKTNIALGAGSPVTMTNVNAGALTDTSTDAVNGSQLYVVDKAVSDLTDALEGSGLIDPATGESLAVTYADATKTDVTLGTTGTPVTLTNVKTGALAATSTDAVNGAQLFTTNQAITDLADALDQGGVFDPGTGESLAVTYADATRTDIALGVPGAPVTMSNVKPGTLSASSTDSVNGSQLFATNQTVGNLKDALDAGGVIDPTTGESLAVTYADATKTDITLGTTGTPVKVSNVKPGALSAASTDTVNGSQLFATNQAITDLADALDNSGIIDPGTGESLAVTYVDASKTGVTLGTTGTSVTVSNVKAGTLSVNSTDTVNGSQLFATNKAIGDLTDALDAGGVIDPTTGESLAVTYADASKTGIALGTAGTPVTISNVKPGVLSAASTDVVNGSQLYTVDQSISDLRDTLDNSGLLDPVTGESLAVTYDDASKDGVTLGGTGATAAVPLHNMGTGTADTDGVNVAQLTTGLSDLKSELTSGSIDLKYIKVNSGLAQANANGTDAVSIGPQSTATAINAVAIGRGARVTASNSVAVGVNSAASQNNVFSVGDLGKERKIINVDDGDISSGSTDAVNGGQLFAVRKALEALAGARGASGVMEVSDPLAAIDGQSDHNFASLNGGNPDEATAAAIGVFSVAGGTNAIAMGLYNVANSDYSVALGYMAQTGVEHDYSVAVGSDVQTNAKYAVALGTQARANGDYAVAMGSNETSAIGESSIALGEAVMVRAKNSIAVGRRARVASNANDALALGAEASVEATAIGGVALGHGAVADRGNAISIGGGSVGTRQITHVSAGTEPTDAVNLAQLQEAMAAMRAEIQLLRSQLGARSAGQ